MRVLGVALLLCLLATAQAFNGYVNSTNQLYVPPGNFFGAERGVDMILNSADATGLQLSFVIPTTVATGTLPKDREVSGVFGNLTRNDGGAVALGIVVNALFRDNSSSTYYRGYRDLYVLVDGVWQRSFEAGCTTPVGATLNDTNYLSTTLCKSGPLAVLQLDSSFCDPDFIRACNECKPGYYGCGCDIPSNNMYTGRDTTRMLAWGIAIAFCLAQALRYVIVINGMPKSSGYGLIAVVDPGDKGVDCMLWLATLVVYGTWLGLVVVFIVRLYSGETGYNTTDQTMKEVTLWRLFAMLGMLASFWALFKSAHTLLAWKPGGSSCPSIFFIVIMVLTEVITTFYVMAAQSWSSGKAHVHIGHQSDVHMAMYVMAFYIAANNGVTWVWFFTDKKRADFNTWYCYLWFVVTMMVIAVALGLMVDINLRLPCE